MKALIVCLTLAALLALPAVAEDVARYYVGAMTADSPTDTTFVRSGAGAVGKVYGVYFSNPDADCGARIVTSGGRVIWRLFPRSSVDFLLPADVDTVETDKTTVQRVGVFWAIK